MRSSTGAAIVLLCCCVGWMLPESCCFDASNGGVIGCCPSTANE